MSEQTKGKRRHSASHRLNAARIVALSFAAVIVLGTVLLSLPIASGDGKSVGVFDAFFTATSATCVTGLAVRDTALTWSLFGQAVILCMIQLGGLGFMTVISLFSLLTRRRIGLSGRLLIASTFSLDTLDGTVRIVKRALCGTFIAEVSGTVLFSFRTIPIFGFARGIWHALFHSVSSFCNAGFDLQGARSGAFSSLAEYTKDPLFLLTTALLVIAGGLGFTVWDDLLRYRSRRRISLYSRLVLRLTAFFLIFGTLFFFFTERNRAYSDLSLPAQWLNAFFQSATLRTAGFSTINQANLCDVSLVLSSLFMLVGGSSGGTAGGMKTVTIWVLAALMSASIRGKKEVTFRGRSLPQERVMNAVNLFLIVCLLTLFGSFFLSLAGRVPFVNALYEAASAIGTVGLTTGLTPLLPFPCKILLAFLMYTGRVGVLSFSFAFLIHGKDSVSVKFPKFQIMVG